MIFFLALLANFLSLFWVVKAHKIELEVLLKNPAFLIGDFVLIPLYFLLMARYLREEPSVASGTLAIIVVMIFGKFFNLFHWEWLPHGIIAWLIIYSYFFGALFSFRNGDYYLLAISSVILLAHEILGAIFPKKL